MAIQIPLPVHGSHAIHWECAEKYDKVLSNHHRLEHSSVCKTGKCVWGISVSRHYSMSKPQRQCVAKDSSVITYIWLSPQKEINEKLQIQEETFNARIEKLRKPWGRSTSKAMLNFRETNQTVQNNSVSRALGHFHAAVEGKPTSGYPDWLAAHCPTLPLLSLQCQMQEHCFVCMILESYIRKYNYC